MLRAGSGSEAISYFGKIGRLLRRFVPRNDLFGIFQHPAYMERNDNMLADEVPYYDINYPDLLCVGPPV
jgi:hypothetical protein